MIIFNTTFQVEAAIAEGFLCYIKASFIPLALKGGLLERPQLAEVLMEQESDGRLFSLQFWCKDENTLEQWHRQSADILLGGIRKAFGTKVLHFSSLLSPIAHE